MLQPFDALGFDALFEKSHIVAPVLQHIGGNVLEKVFRQIRQIVEIGDELLTALITLDNDSSLTVSG